jgi:Phage portal protein, SPP1 Gp6-like
VVSNLLAEPRDAERTPEDWRRTLLARLAEQRTEALIYDAYYDGRHPLQFASAKFREAFGSLFAAFADNWCQIVVDASVERLRVVGFQVDGRPNDDAWSIWQANALDVESVIAHTEAGKAGQAFLLVDPNEGQPRITVEHAAQVVVATDPGDRRKRRAALKRWVGDDGYVYVTLYLPDSVLKFESKEPLVGDLRNAAYAASQIEWVERNGGGFTTNELGVVPVIPLENKPGLLGGGHSDLEPAIPIQNAVNKLCTDMIVASEYGAFPARVLTGVEVPRDPETNRPIYTGDELKMALSRFLALEDPSAGAISLPAADLANYVNAVEMFIQHLAAQTRTPPHYLLAKLVNASGDALSVAEAGLVSKCRGKILFFSDAWEEAIALALTAAGRETETADCEAIWQNPERIAQGALVDAAVKKQTLGIPDPVIWLELGYTPEQIGEWEAAAPPPPPQPPPQQQPPPFPPPQGQTPEQAAPPVQEG